jgi:prolyl oligopeptidase
MDAIQNVRDGLAYPGGFLAASANDARVQPWQSAKFAARLQAASTSGRPILVTIARGTGHQLLTPELRALRTADFYSFLLWQFGHPDFQPRLSR